MRSLQEFSRHFKTFQRLNWLEGYGVRQKLSCNSTNVIYLVYCKKFNLQYVGSTTTEFKIRFRNQKSTMKTNKKTCEVALHFNRTPHVLSDFTFQCIDQIQTNTCPVKAQKSYLSQRKHTGVRNYFPFIFWA